MMRSDVIELIKESQSAHGVHASVQETAREVFCTVRSVGRTEYYTALNAGIMPELVFHLALAEEYEGERYARYRGQKWRIVRSYMTSDDGIELTAERSDVNGED
jgi:hypothetical protein